MVLDPADDSLVSREIEQPCGTGRCSACGAVFSSARALMAEKRPVSVCEQASEVLMVLPSRSGASHGCDCIHCVPCLHYLAGVFSVLFSTALRAKTRHYDLTAGVTRRGMV